MLVNNYSQSKINDRIILPHPIRSSLSSYNSIFGTGSTKHFPMPTTPLLNKKNPPFPPSCSTKKWHSIKINTRREFPTCRTTKKINQSSCMPTYHIWRINFGSTTLKPWMYIYLRQYKSNHIGP